MKSFFSALSIFCLSGILLLSNCSKESSADPANLAISLNSVGGIIEVGSSFDLNTTFVNLDGLVQTITYTESWSSSNEAVASISSEGIITAKAPGAIFLKVSVVIDGKTFSASVPYQVVAKGTEGKDKGQGGISEFVVAPGAILWSTLNSIQTLQIEYAYFGSGTLSNFSYSSSNSSVATVSNSGLVTFKVAGEAIITVSASNGAKTFTQFVPVLVLGTPEVKLNTITRIEITPTVKKLFIDQTHNFTAKAYNASGQEVNTTFTWEIEDAEPDTIDGQIIKGATVQSSGLVKAMHPSVVKVKASASGVTGSATVMVYPDGYYVIDPMILNISKNSTKSLNAAYYEFDTNFNPLLKPWPNSSKWQTMFALFPVPGFPAPGTLTSNGSSASYATDFMSMGIDVIFVYDPGKPKVAEGACAVTVGF